MTFVKMIKTFTADENGAVTVDWVVLTAAMVALGLIVGTAVTTSTKGLNTKITNAINDMEVVAE